PTAAPGRATLWGYVRLVPREGVHPAAPGGGAYADPRLRDAALVDYSRPGFAVVYLDAGASGGGAGAPALRATPSGGARPPRRGAGRGRRARPRRPARDPQRGLRGARDLVPGAGPRAAPPARRAPRAPARDRRRAALLPARRRRRGGDGLRRAGPLRARRRGGALRARRPRPPPRAGARVAPALPARPAPRPPPAPPPP